MHAELTIDGGLAGNFPGLAAPIVLDGKDLSPDQKAEFLRLVSAARAETHPARDSAAKPIPDGRKYRLSIAMDHDDIKLRAADPTVPPAFAALKNFVVQHGHR
ncbi:hypothetical protein LMG28614_07076 [Paraburkholderia ultramafica]|uniref:Uncharacterized protein n=1 Tax=Paraburkholderia ultramafica TaxID=1544867 RepID=A0A6S7CHH0_9BURK|nr:protealysin inhibitor emfourin [Paraburkholderia ultramafica]CAB3809588.1 hypothetical protein LMG28614_07076 [Paraburkholderia ultramafica]